MGIFRNYPAMGGGSSSGVNGLGDGWWNGAAKQAGGITSHTYYSVSDGDTAGGRFPNQGASDYVAVLNLDIRNASRSTGNNQWHYVKPGNTGNQLPIAMTRESAAGLSDLSANLHGLIFPPDTRWHDYSADHWSAAYIVSSTLADFATLGFDTTNNVVPTDLNGTINSNSPITAAANTNGCKMWWFTTATAQDVVNVNSDDAGTLDTCIIHRNLGTLLAMPHNRIWIPAGFDIRQGFNSSGGWAWKYE